MRGLTIAIAALALAGCEPATDMVAVADQAVVQFHQRLDNNQVATIKAEGEPGQAITGDRAAGMLDALRIRLGRVVSSKRTALKDEYGDKGRMLTMTFDTVYADGKATEEFVYHITGGKAVLFGYSTVATDNAVTEFHKNLDAGDFDAIDAIAGPEIKSSGKDFTAILDEVHTKMGVVRSTKCASFNAKVDADGVRTIELTYQTEFAKGPEIEEFVFHIKPDGKVELGGYFVKPASEK